MESPAATGTTAPPPLPTPTAAPTRDPIPVRVISPSEYKAAGHALAEAFATDAVARYFLDTPDRAHWPPARKWALHVAITTYITRAHALCGAVTTAGPDYASVALWLPPGTHADSLATALRSGLWRLRYKLSAEGRARFFAEFLPLLHDTKRAVLGPARDKAAWYLVYLGTRPAARGRGYARACLGWGTAQADATGAPVYLESSAAANLPLYRRLGFEVATRIRLVRAVGRVEGGARVGAEAGGPDELGEDEGQGEVPMDIMVREPVSGKNAGAGVGVLGDGGVNVGIESKI